MKSYLLSVLAIVCCAAPAAILSWLGWKSVGLTGITLSLVTVFSAMILATALFAALAAIGRVLKITK